MFDCNKMAQGLDYFQLVGILISPDNTKVAFGVDTFPEGNIPFRQRLNSGKLIKPILKTPRVAVFGLLITQHFLQQKIYKLTL